MVKQEERSASTRAKLLEAFRRLLLSRGLQATTTQLVLEDTGLSKGALYHHFRSKDEIIEALYAQESEATLERAFGPRNVTGPPLERVKGGCIAWLDEVKDTDVAAILFRIGPSALGQERASAIEDQQGIARIRALLEEAAEDGIALGNVELLASFINSLVAQAVLHRLKSGNEVGDDLERAIDAMIDRFAGVTR
ncbi:TetR/AcrR family transcriptional regulator [Qipengyuania vesicularis]|uniref:TetR/AcrR family transcriptional regulator n=1 Tax=Qipengyuania vesicularis TaxID=2867232 RepID=UPI001C8727B0|nr:TetR/AcrR family transcriptional regulator [Qipengyuania vesicularis]MBX7526346.1 TetR/AcrR family transcriptional regulator [Qipengyuania vesicularis]